MVRTWASGDSLRTVDTELAQADDLLVLDQKK